MSDVKDFPYDTRLNVLHGALEVIDEKSFSDAQVPWFNQTLCQVNASVVRVGVIQGEYHWHKHDDDDEFFYVVEGRLLIDLEGRTVELHPGRVLLSQRRVASDPFARENRYPHGGKRRDRSHRKYAQF